MEEPISSPTESGQGHHKLRGTWKLVSASSQTSKGERNATPYGANPAGFLTYSNEGRVTAIISYDGRTPLPAEGGTLEEQAEAYRTFLGYAGRYTLSGDKVSHHVEVSSIQSLVGKDLIRHVEYHGEQIRLTTPPTRLEGRLQTVELVWDRVR